MKKAFVRLMAFFAPMVPLTLSAQTYSQPIPDNITEIRVEDNARVVVTEGADATIASATNERVATVKGSRMLVSDNVNATITLPAGRPFTVVAEDHSQVVFQGSFGQRPAFTVRSEDYASVTFSGSLADSVWTGNLSLRADDYSSIRSEVVMASQSFAFSSFDYANIHLACKTNIGTEQAGTVHINDQSNIEFNFCHGDSVVPYEINKGVDAKKYVVRHTLATDNKKRSSFWRRRDVALNFAWGFHNWGSEPLGGFSGVDGPANVRTSFNHIHLSVDFPLVGTRHTGLYIGLGLDWDKYKVTTPEVTFDPASAAFAEGTTQDCSSRLLTRYVVVPLTLRIDLWHDWHLSLAALPGIHWSGSHTGLRREYETSDREELQKDQSVNQHINPYKLDLRATLTYEWFGLYLQVPTRSTMKSPMQDLYPIRFGVMLTLD